MLNDVLATELVCVLHYRRYHFMARGLDSQRIARELLAHSYKELGHAARVAERIVQLGGEPDLAPDWLASPGHARYIEGDSLEAMMQEIQLAERDAIDRYRVFIRYLREHDPTTRHMLEGILAVEEKHAHELADLLVAFPDNSSGMSPAAT
jgi:bacterioferritin